MSFMDMPPETVLRRALRRWAKPAAPAEVESVVRSLTCDGEAGRASAGAELHITDWLYAFIRLNIKRGPVFDLRDALRLHRADCLAYCKLFTVLGRRMGLDAGVVDVLIVTGGRYVPHTAVLVKMTGDRSRLADLWYGSRDIRHRRLGLRTKEGRRWVVTDISYSDFKTLDVSYLPDSYVDGITLYVLGNRYLNRGELTLAVEYYSRAIRLYPESIRPFYNRAIALEKLGKSQLAEADYQAAFRDENALIRTMAHEHPKITALILLDEIGIDEKAQEIYLLRKGIITGRAVPLPRIAAGFGLSEERVMAILSGIDRKLKKSAN